MGLGVVFDQDEPVQLDKNYLTSDEESVESAVPIDLSYEESNPTSTSSQISPFNFQFLTQPPPQAPSKASHRNRSHTPHITVHLKGNYPSLKHSGRLNPKEEQAFQRFTNYAKKLKT